MQDHKTCVSPEPLHTPSVTVESPTHAPNSPLPLPFAKNHTTVLAPDILLTTIVHTQPYQPITMPLLLILTITQFLIMWQRLCHIWGGLVLCRRKCHLYGKLRLGIFVLFLLEKNAVSCKWVFTIKVHPDGSLHRLKARNWLPKVTPSPSPMVLLWWHIFSCCQNGVCSHLYSFHCHSPPVVAPTRCQECISPWHP